MESVITALGTAFSGIATDLTSVFSTILPIALGVLALTMVARLGVRWFKTMIK